MSTPVGPRHNHSLKRKVPVGKVQVGRKHAQKEEKMQKEEMTKEENATEMGKSAGKLFTFTIDASTGQVVRLEVEDASGERHELSDEEKASLAQAGGAGDLEQLVERAFEAGIACVLGGEPEDKAEELADEAELRHLLLTPLIEYSPARRLLQREVLNRAILGTLIHHAMKAPTDAESSRATGLQSERAAPTRAN